jgi:hypothetical protein
MDPLLFPARAHASPGKDVRGARGFDSEELMKTTMTRRTKAWILSAALAAGVAGLAPSALNPLAATPAYARDLDETVRYEDLPREVKRTVDEERGRRDVRSVQHVIRDGREFYRVAIDDKGSGNTELRVNRDGKVLGSEQGDDLGREREVRFSSLPREVQNVIDRERGNRELKAVYEVNRDGRTFYRAIINERNGDRMLRVSESGKLLQDEDIREVRTAAGGVSRDIDNGRDDAAGERIAFDRLPGEVKTALGREAGPDKVREVVQYRHGGQTMYRAEISNGDRTRIVRVDENGRIVNEADDTDAGRRNVNFRDLPGEVKSAIGSELNANEIDRVTQITRDGRTYYRAVDRSGKSVTVDDRGRIDRKR